MLSFLAINIILAAISIIIALFSLFLLIYVLITRPYNNISMAICTDPAASLQNTDCSVAKRRQSSTSALVIFEEERPEKITNVDSTDVVKNVSTLPKAEPSING